MPRLSELGVFWALAALLLLLAAVFFRSELVLAFASVAVFTLAADLILALPLGRRARAAGLELSWRILEPSAERMAVRGAKIRIHGWIMMRDGGALRLTHLKPIAPRQIQLESITHSVHPVAERPQEIELTIRSLTAGRSVLQGLATRAVSPFGAFVVGVYFPHPLEVRASPQRVPSLSALEPRVFNAIVPREGFSSARARGPGVELHELREYRPGDPLRSIANVASARRGRLLVRETERPFEEEHQILLDVGAEMLVGPLGARPLDQAVDAIWTLLDELSARSHRIRLTLFDDQLLGEWTSDGGIARSSSLRKALLEALERYDRRRIEGGEEEVAALVAAHLRDQEALDYETSTAGKRARLASALRPRVRSLLPDPERADSFEILLAYCKRYGLELPPKTLRPTGARKSALRSILLHLARRGHPHSIHLFSGLDEIALDGELKRVFALKALRGRVTLYLPRILGAPDESEFGGAIRQIARWEREEAVRQMSPLIRPASLTP